MRRLHLSGSEARFFFCDTSSLRQAELDALEVFRSANREYRMGEARGAKGEVTAAALASAPAAADATTTAASDAALVVAAAHAARSAVLESEAPAPFFCVSVHISSEKRQCVRESLPACLPARECACVRESVRLCETDGEAENKDRGD